MAERMSPAPPAAHHERARIAGVNEGEPKRNADGKLDPRDAIRRFSSSIVTPTRDASGFDIPNPDFLPTRTNIIGQRLKPAPDQNPSPELLTEIADQQRLRDPETGQRLNAVLLNREAITAHPENAVSVYHGLYMNVVGQKDESGLRIQELARQMPNRGLISFDFPGMGDSDPLTHDQKSRHGADDFFGIPDAELRILQELGVKKINVFGISMGGLMSLAIAARARNFEIDVENVIPIGTPGLRHVPLPLMGLYSAKEMTPQLLNLHHSSPADPRMWQVSHLERPDEMQLPEPPSETWKNDPFLRYARMMSKDTVGKYVRTTLDTQPLARLLFVNGSTDRISPPARVHSLIQTLRREPGDDTRFQQVIMPGDGHLALIHPQKLAPLIKSQLDGSFL